jgi:hypothetical protein
MAEKVSDKNRYPQIPATVWWGVRAILNKTPSAVLDDRFLAIQLGVQEVAARQYITELTAVGLLNEDKKATPLALEWRLDSSYSDAVEKLVANVYPQALRDLAPHAEGDRQKATSFFMREGFGQGAAGNKAATYFLIGAANPNESPVRPTQSRPAKTDGDASGTGAKGTRSPRNASPRVNAAGAKGTQTSRVRGTPDSNAIPLNVNVQIHISADAGTEQIEAIFSAMRRYLYDKQTA